MSLSGETLGLDPLGLTVKFIPEGAGRPEALSEGAGVSDGGVIGVVPVSEPVDEACANAAVGNRGATITTNVIPANTFVSPVRNLFTVIKKPRSRRKSRATRQHLLASLINLFRVRLTS